MNVSEVNVDLGALPGSLPHTVREAKSDGYSKLEINQMMRSGKIECETCANRKYQDGSDEMVSFKSPTHISPQSAAAAVMAHEQEHVKNAYKKAGNNDGEVVRASVRIKTSVCPECGRTYVSGGETTTQIKYDDKNPYAKNFKGMDAAGIAGSNFDVKFPHS